MKSIEAERSSAEIKKNGCLRTVETNIQEEGEKEIEFFSSRDQVGADKSSKNGENMEKDGLQMISIVDYSNQGLEQSSSEQADYVIVNAVFEVYYRYFSLVLVKYILDGSLEVGCPKKSNSIQFDFFWKVKFNLKS